jgi:uncharacterized membrane protein YoaK (UPF0700 family)
LIHEDHRHVSYHVTRILLVSMIAGMAVTVAGVIFSGVIELLGPLTVVFAMALTYPMSARAYQRAFEDRVAKVRDRCVVCEEERAGAR